MSYPTGAHACECPRCFRGFVSDTAFTRHQRTGKVCLEPSSIGMWLATDGQWSLEPRSPVAEYAAKLAAVGRMMSETGRRRAQD